MISIATRLKATQSALAMALGISWLLIPAGIPVGESSPHLSRLALLTAASLPWLLTAGVLLRWSYPYRLPGRVLVITSTIVSARFGMHQLGTYDVSSIVDLGWRYELGQVPFRDFPLTLPPAFSATVRICWSLLGHNWASFVGGSTAITICLVLFAWGALSRTEFDSARNETLVSLAVVIPHLAIGHIWHSAMASQVAVVTVLWLVAWRFSPSRRSAAALGLFLGLLLLSKPNIAGPLTLVSGAWIFLHWRSRHVLTLLISLVGSVGTVLVISKSDPSRVLTTTVELLSSRSRPTQLLPGGLDGFSKFFFVCTYALLFAALVGSVGAVLHALVRKSQVARMTFLLGLGCAVASLVGMATNWDIKSSDMPLAILAVLLALWSTDSMGTGGPISKSTTVLASAVIVGLTLMNLSVGSTRWRMELAGPMTQPEPTATLQGRVLGGVRAAPILQAVDQQLTQALAESDNRNVFLGPRLELFYSRFALESPKGLPLWWHDGTAYAARDLKEISATFRSAGFSRAIFFKQDFTRFPPEIRQIIDDQYEIDERYSQLTIFWAKTD